MDLADHLRTKIQQKKIREEAYQERKRERYHRKLTREITRWLRKQDQLAFKGEPRKYEFLYGGRYNRHRQVFMVTFTDGSRLPIAHDSNNEERIFLVDRW